MSSTSESDCMCSVQTTVLMKNMEDYKDINEIYAGGELVYWLDSCH